jgi:ankyrin repeat protein
MPSANALELAVALNDPGMLALLLPVSDESARRSALWRAAELNQLKLVQFLVQAGVPLSIRGDILDQNNTLLVAAASGGALDVGRWLIDSRHFPVNALVDGPDPYEGEAPLHALFRFMMDVHKSPRTPLFLRMLVEHGVDINASFDSAGTLLQEAVRIGDKDIARQLLDAGARKSLLDPARQAALAALLAKPDERDYSPQPREGCVQVGGAPLAEGRHAS